MSSDAETLMYWVRAYNQALDVDGDTDKTYCFWRAREWASYLLSI